MARIGKLVFFVLALPAVARAVLRLRRLEGQSLERVVGALRAVEPFRWPALSNPRYLAGVASRLEPLLPVPGYGPCMKRSLLLLDLWSRCGLQPRLHLGVLPGSGEGARSHAWISAEAGAGEIVSTSPAGYPPLFDL